MTRVVNMKAEPCTVYIGRPSKWGNPFKVGGRTRDQAISQYREWIEEQPELLAALPELEGEILGCYCKPLACHGDVLVELVQDAVKGEGG